VLLLKRTAWAVLTLTLILIFSTCSGCSVKTKGSDPAGTPGGMVKQTDPPKNSALTLAGIKKAAQDAGYAVSDGHQLLFMKDGFCRRRRGNLRQYRIQL